MMTASLVLVVVAVVVVLYFSSLNNRWHYYRVCEHYTSRLYSTYSLNFMCIFINNIFCMTIRRGHNLTPY